MWLYVLKNMDKLDRMPFKAQKQLFEKLEKIAGITNLTQKERQEYDEALKVYRDCTNIVDYAKDEGREEGRAEGLVEGEEIGINKGIRHMAANLKKQGVDTKTNSTSSGLSEEEIKNL